MTDLDTIIQNGKSGNGGNETLALNEIEQLPYQYPEIVELLEWMQNNTGRRTRGRAKKLLSNHMNLPLASEVEGNASEVETGDGYSDEIGDSDLETGEYEHESSLSSAQEDRLDAKAAGKGLVVLHKEQLKLDVSSDGTVEKISPGEGTIIVQNSGSSNRIYGIDLKLENTGDVEVEEGEFTDNISIGDLDADETWVQKYSFEKEFDPINISIKYFDPESGLSPDFLGKEDVGFVCEITGANTYEQPITNFTLRKTVGENGNVENYDVSHGEVSTEGKDVIVKVEEIPAGDEFKFTINLKGTLPEGVEAYETGKTVVTYDVGDLTISPLVYKAIDGISDAKQRIRRREREENPGMYDCEFNFENLSEFTYDMLELKIFPKNLGQKGSVDPIIDWDGLSVTEDEREVQPTEKNDFEFVYESPDKAPSFGSIVKFGVQSYPNVLTEAILTIPTERLRFMKMTVDKAYEITEVASYSRTEVPATVTIHGVGTQPLEALVVKDKVPAGFDNVDTDAIEVFYNGEKITEGFEISGDATGDGDTDGDRLLEVNFEHLEEIEAFEGGLNKDDVIEIKYPTAVIKPPKDSEPLKGGVNVEGFIYVKEEEKIYAEAEDEIVGLTVIHQRITIDVSKAIQGVTRDGEKAFKITLEGQNYGSKTTSFVISDFIPKGFNIVDGPNIAPEDAAEESEESSEDGKMMSWSFENIEPDTTFTVVYVIVGEEGVVFNPREAQVMGQA